MRPPIGPEKCKTTLWLKNRTPMIFVPIFYVRYGMGLLDIGWSVSKCFSQVFARGRHYGADRAIRYALPRISSFLLFFFFYPSFLMISRRQIISRSARPIFAISTSNERFLAIDNRSGPLFSISQGTLPWQPILCKKWKTPHFRRSDIQKRYEVTPCMGRIK